jgi:hypothetical protein
MSLYVCISCKAFTVSLGIFELGPDNRSRQDDGLEEAGGLNGSGEPGLKAYASAFVHVISRYFTFVPTMFPFPSLPCAVSLRWRNPLRNYTAAKA